MGIAIAGEVQLLLSTRGNLGPHRRLDRAMVAAAWRGPKIRPNSPGDRRRGQFGTRLEACFKRWRTAGAIAAGNKTDIAKKEKLLEFAEMLSLRLKPEAVFMVSSTTGDGIADLKHALAASVPECPWHFPDDQLSDATDRMVAAEMTREQLYLQLHAELPYSSAVDTEKWEDRKDGSTVIHQQILVERDSQKAIVLGKGGSRLKAIGQAAREAIGEHLGRKVHLFLHVKVNPKWDEDRSLYRDIGLDWAD